MIQIRSNRYDYITKKFTPNNILLLIVYPISVIAKLFQFIVLPDKYFYDSEAILRMTNNSFLQYSVGDGSYVFTAEFFRIINIFGFSSLLEWAVFISFFCNILIIRYFKKNKIQLFSELIIACCFLFLLNIYVFNISKDILQFLFFYVIFNVIKSDKLSMSIKHTLVIGMFVLESIFFRSYYILTAVFYVCAVIGLPFLRKYEKKGILLTVLSIGLVIYAFLAVSQLIMPDEYYSLVNIRNKLNLYRVGSADASTMILNLIQDNGSLPLYILNYFINAFRMMFPIELISKGFLQIAFMIFQLICTVLFLKKLKGYYAFNAFDRSKINIMIAYFLTAFIFEPDFGSFVRHEVATFVVFYSCLFIDNSTEKNNEINSVLTN